MKKTKLMAVLGLAACMFAACDDDVSSAGKNAEGDSAHVVDTLYMFSKDTVVIWDSVFVSDTVVVMDSLILWDTLYLNDSTIKKDSSCVVTEQGEKPANPNCMAASGGLCTACKNGYYGPSCENVVTCMHGRAYGGIDGDGKCISCEAGYYGENCDKAATCINGTVSLGIDGTGLCVSCNAGYRLENGACNPELYQIIPGCLVSTGDYCLVCEEGFYGPTCEKNTCQHGTAFDGINGNGHCSECFGGWAGSDCDQCAEGYSGENCDIKG